MIELRVLGTLDLRELPDGSPFLSVLTQPKRTAVLTYLALARPRGLRRRDTLLATFWPDATEERARNSLNQAVFVLRRALGSQTIVTRGPDELGLDASRLRCDAVAFEEALDAGDRSRALELYDGELLEGFHLGSCPAFERWLDVERSRLRQLALKTALDLAEEHEVAGNPVEAVYWVRRAATWSPYDEAILQRLVALLQDAGDRAGAVREYEAFRDRLAAELEIEPSAETEALARELRRGPVEAAGAEPTAQRVPPAEPGPFPGSAPSPAPVARSDRPAPELAVAARRAAPSTTAASERPHARRPRARTLAAVGAMVVVAVFAALIHRRSRPRTPPLDARRVLVVPFVNRTGDAGLDAVGLMAGDWIAQGLARSGLVRVVPISAVLRDRRDERSKAGGPAPEPYAIQLARDMGAGLIVSGAVYARGDSLDFQSLILGTGTGEVERAVGEVTGPREHPAHAVATLRERTLGSLATLTDERLASWASPDDQPPDLEAYRLLAAGFDRFFTAGQQRQLGTANAEAVRLNRQAAALFLQAAGSDSSFVTPLLWAVFARANAGDHAASDSLVEALEGRHDLSAWERALLEYQAAHARADREETYRRARTLVELSPGSEWLYAFAIAAYDTRRYHTAIAALERIDPDRGWIVNFPSYWHLRIEARHSMGDHARELADVRELKARFPEDRDLPRMELVALAALGRSDELLEHVHTALATGDGRVTPWLDWITQELRAHGHDRAARQVVEAGLAYFGTPPPGADERSWLAARGRLLEVAGRWEAARSIWERLAARYPEHRAYRARLGVLAARQGDRAGADSVDAWLRGFGSSFGAGPFDVNGGPLIWRARIATQLGERDRATTLIRRALDGGMRHSYLLLHALKDLDPLRGYSPFEALLQPRDPAT